MMVVTFIVREIEGGQIEIHAPVCNMQSSELEQTYAIAICKAANRAIAKLCGSFSLEAHGPGCEEISEDFREGSES